MLQRQQDGDGVWGDRGLDRPPWQISRSMAGCQEEETAARPDYPATIATLRHTEASTAAQTLEALLNPYSSHQRLETFQILQWNSNISVWIFQPLL